MHAPSIFASLLAVALTACSNPSPDGGTPPGELPAAGPPAAATVPAVTAGQDALASALGRYHWQLQRASDVHGTPLAALTVSGQPPPQLDFAAGQVAVSNTCNRMSGRYTLDAGTLQLDRLASTRMACAGNARTAQERAVAALLPGRFAATLDADAETPTLTLQRNDGTTLRFAGALTDEARYGAGDTRFLEVAADTQACSHPLIPDTQCLQVRELHYDAQGIRRGEPGPWQAFYNEIDGYTHETGTRNVLRVRHYLRQDVPADASRDRYVLDLVVESEHAGR